MRAFKSLGPARELRPPLPTTAPVHSISFPTFLMRLTGKFSAGNFLPETFY